MISEAYLASDNLTRKSSQLNDINNSVAGMHSEMRKQSQDFYYRLSLLSGGVLSLNITYLGYLSTHPSIQVVFGEFLFVSWVLLIISIFTSLYRNFFNLDMGHWQTLISINDARIDQQRALLQLIKISPSSIAGINNQEDIQRQTTSTSKAIKSLEKGGRELIEKEGRNKLLWQLCQKASHLSFVLGIVLIVIFAWLNLPVHLNFTLINFMSGFVKN